METSSKSRKMFIKNLRKYRLMRDMTLEQLSSECDLSYTYLSTVENGRNNISMDNADKIAKALGISLAVLLIDDC